MRSRRDQGLGVSRQEDDERTLDEDAAARRGDRGDSGGVDPGGCIVVIVGGFVAPHLGFLRLLC